MAEKCAVLLKYEYLTFIERAKLSDADSWLLVKGIIEYDKTGTEPEYENPVSAALFGVIQIDLDKNKKRWNEILLKNSENGKKGGAPSGNCNAIKQPKTSETTQNNPKQHECESDLGNESDSEFEDQEFVPASAPETIIMTVSKPPTVLKEQQAAGLKTAGLKTAGLKTAGLKTAGLPDLTPDQLVLFHAAKACFETSEKAKKIMYQDKSSAQKELACIKTLIFRCAKIAPEIPESFLKNVLEHFRIMTNGKLKGKAVFTPRSLITPWIWELVISSLPEDNVSPELLESIKGMFK